jgi:hypothetical protein
MTWFSDRLCKLSNEPFESIKEGLLDYQHLKETFCNMKLLSQAHNTVSYTVVLDIVHHHGYLLKPHAAETGCFHHQVRTGN